MLYANLQRLLELVRRYLSKEESSQQSRGLVEHVVRVDVTRLDPASVGLLLLQHVRQTG